MKNKMLKLYLQWSCDLLVELNNHDEGTKKKINLLLEQIIEERNVSYTKERYIELCNTVLLCSNDLFNNSIDTFLLYIAEYAVSKEILINTFFANYLNRYLSNKIISVAEFIFYYQKLSLISYPFIGYNNIVEKFTIFKFNNETLKIISDKLNGKVENDILLGYYYLSINKVESAIDSFINAIGKDNLCSPAYEEISVYYLLQNMWENALNYGIKFVESNLIINEYNSHKIALVSANIAHCCYRMKMYEDAERYYKKALVLEPHDNIVKNELSYCYYLQGKYDEGLKYIDKCINEKDEDDFDLTLQWNKIRIFTKQKKYHEALKVLESMKKNARGKKSIQKKIESIEQKLLKSEDSKSIQNNNNKLESQIEKIIPNGSFLNQTEDQEIESKSFDLSKHEIEIMSEKFLEDLIYQKIYKGEITLGLKLNIYRDKKNKYGGRQYPIPSYGRIDLLTTNESGDFVIIELKKGKADYIVFGQISNYIGWVKDNLAQPNQKVNGIICVYEADNTLKSAISTSSNITLYEYKYNKMLS